MTYCSDCIHYKVCGNEGVDDVSMIFCLDKQPGWIPVSERLPEDYKPVIVTTIYGVYDGARYSKVRGWKRAFNYWEDLPDVMAWMPLPAPYKESEGGGTE